MKNAHKRWGLGTALTLVAGSMFLTQEEFSNKDFAITGGGCVQNAKQEA